MKDTLVLIKKDYNDFIQSLFKALSKILNSEDQEKYKIE